MTAHVAVSRQEATSWRVRLREWWTGESATMVAETPAPKAARAMTEHVESVADAKSGRWTPARIAVAQALFGAGECRPSMAVHFPALVGLNLTPRVTVAIVGAGLGGMVRYLADTGVAVIGLEPEAALVAASDREDVRHVTGGRLRLTNESIDHAICLETLHSFAEPRGVLEQLRRAIKPGGKLLLSDFVRTCEPDNPSYLVWEMHEPGEPVLFSAPEIRAELQDLGFEIENAETIDPAFRSAVTAAFAVMADAARLGGNNVAFQAALVAEAELWTRRLAAVQAGNISVRRFLCRAPAKAAPGVKNPSILRG